MSSLVDCPQFSSKDLTSLCTPHYTEHDLSLLTSALPIDSNCFAYFDNTSYLQQLSAVYNDQTRHCTNSTSRPSIRLESSTPAPLPLACDVRQDPLISVNDWQMYQSGMNSGPSVTTHRPFKRARTSHQRTPSASTVASNGPASPYTATASYPQIANTDFDPNSPGQVQYADQAGLFSKNLPTPQQTPTDAQFMNSAYIPSHLAHTPSAHMAMKGFAIDHHQLADEIPPEFYTSSRHSMSSHGNNSPATPHSVVGENYDQKHYMPQNGKINNHKYDAKIKC